MLEKRTEFLKSYTNVRVFQYVEVFSVIKI